MKDVIEVLIVGAAGMVLGYFCGFVKGYDTAKDKYYVPHKE